MAHKYRTDMVVLVGTRNGYPVYRSVYIENGHYYVTWNRKAVNVDDDIQNGSFHSKSAMRA